jgi:predicted histidine transporter YuiF (NhaC family)
MLRNFIFKTLSLEISASINIEFTQTFLKYCLKILPVLTFIKLFAQGNALLLQMLMLNLMVEMFLQSLSQSWQLPITLMLLIKLLVKQLQHSK